MSDTTPWRRASLPAVKPGFLAQRKETHTKPTGMEMPSDPEVIMPSRAARMPPYVRQGGLTLPHPPHIVP